MATIIELPLISDEGVVAEVFDIETGEHVDSTFNFESAITYISGGQHSATAALTQHLGKPQRLTDEEFQSLLDEYYALERTIRELNMSFHLGERRHRLIPSATQEALEERSTRMDALLAQEKALRDRLIQAAD